MTSLPLLLLAADHRNSLERDLYELTEPPTAEQAERIVADKLIVYEALLEALKDLPKDVQPGILIDEQYGAEVAELVKRTDGTVRLAMPIEASGEKWFHFAYGDQWKAHAEYFGADYPKILVRDNPGLDGGEREAQASRVAEVSSWARDSGRPLIIELIVPATPHDLERTGGSQPRYDDELRPGYMVSVIEYLQDHGVDPAIWKVEGLDRHDDAVAITEVARRAGRDARCLVLGRHASQEQVVHWLRIAAPIPGFIGFAIGRSIWWDPLLSHLHHRSTATEARRQIAAAYVTFVNDYLSGRKSGPPEL